MASTSSGNLSVNFDLDPFGDEFGDDDDDLIAQAYDETIAVRESSPKPGPSFARPSQPHTTGALAGFDHVAGKNWIYPVNYPLRTYQFAIVEQALFKNTLVSLPTGLGKTFIAAVVMYNFFRWYPRSKIVFMAPTKPLVAQQVEACFNIVGIPQSDISQMTGSMSPNSRIQEWQDKRIFFLTPQVLTNDLARGICPSELIKCLVLDEAHKALGNHAYCQVVKELRERRCEFRILALSATPGSDMNAVKQVLTNLLISHIELRSEDSPDLLPYSHQRSIEKIVVPLGVELTNATNKYLNVLRVYVNRLLDMNVLFTRDETTLTKFQLLQAREAFRQNPPGNIPNSRYGVVEGLFALCVTLYHAYDLMLLHGIRSAYKFLKGTLFGDKGRSYARSELLRNDLFRNFMDDMSKKFDVEESQPTDNSSTSKMPNQTLDASVLKSTKESFVASHPKMSHMCSLVVDHHKKFEAEGKSTRIMIFSQYRDSVLEITEMLHHHEPLVKAMSFVGQGTVGRGSRGISQKEQLRVVKEFKEGGFNTLVSTCVGEEGLDIGDVDLIICYDAPKSPIRLVQRMGRTGRKREGRIVVLITKGKEEQMYKQSQYQKGRINSALANTNKLTHCLYTNSSRMIPAGVHPVCQKLHMKVDEWKAKAKGGRKKSSTSNSILKFTSSSSKSSVQKGKNHFLSELEWNWYKETLAVEEEEVKTVSKPTFTCLSKEEMEGTSIYLGSYQPWQNSLQPSHLFGHSLRAKNLVQLTEFVDIQVTLEEDEDPYGLEMATFLDKSYLVDDHHQQQRLAVPPPPVLENDKKEPKDSKKSKKSSLEKNKVKNNALITTMFAKISSSAPASKPGSSQISEGALGSVKENFTKKDINYEDNDDDITVIHDSFVQATNAKDHKFVQATKAKDHNQELEGSSSPGPAQAPENDNVSPASLGEECMEVCENEIEGIGLNGHTRSRNISMIFELPDRISGSPFQVHTPPDIGSVDECDLISYPDSPTEIISAVDEWVKEREEASSLHDDLDEVLLNLPLAKGKTPSVLDIDNKRMSPTCLDHEDDNEELPDLLFGLRNKLSPKKDLGSNQPPFMSEPCQGRVYAEDSELERCGSSVHLNFDADVTPKKSDTAEVSPGDIDVSPVFSSSYRLPIRRNLKICASTPVSAKRLFKVNTPDLTAIEKNSLLPAGENSDVTPGKGDSLNDPEPSKNRTCINTPIRDNNRTPSENATHRPEPSKKRTCINTPIRDNNRTPSENATHRPEPSKNRTCINTPIQDNNRTPSENAASRIRAKLNRFSAVPRKENEESKNVSESRKGCEASKNSTTDIEENTLVQSEEGEKIESDKGPTEVTAPAISKQGNSSDCTIEENGKELLQRILNSKNKDVLDGGEKTKNHHIEKAKSNLSEGMTKETVTIHSSAKKGVAISSGALLFNGTNSARKKLPNAVDNGTGTDGLGITSSSAAPDSNRDGFNMNTSKGKPALSISSNRIDFDLGLDDDLFADMDLDDVNTGGKKDPSEEDMRNDEKENYNCDVAEPLNKSTSARQKLLSVTQIIDIVDEDSDVFQPKLPLSRLNSSRRLSLNNISPGQGSLLSRNSPKLVNDEGGDSVMRKESKTLSLANKDKKSEKAEATALPDFSLMDDIDFDVDDFESKNDSPTVVDFNLLGTDEFQPENISDHDKMTTITSLTSGTKSHKSNSAEMFGADTSHSFLSKSKEPSCSPAIKTPKRLLSSGETSLKCLSSRKKMLTMKSPDSPVIRKKLPVRSPDSPITPSQDAAYVWKRRERKACNVLGSDSEEHSLQEESFQGNSSGRHSHSSSSVQSRNCSAGKPRTRSLEEAETDDDDFASEVKLMPKKPGPSKMLFDSKKRMKRKQKHNDFIEREADVSNTEMVVISSDESEHEDGYVNDSFVDDGCELTQDPNVDMKAMYLKSIVSPVKLQREPKQQRAVYISDPEEHSEVEDSEDSFVVANDVVEYNTEYLGESMLAEDSIMLEAMEENFKCNKMSGPQKSLKNKRKRIILDDSSSEEEAEKAKKSKLMSPPVMKTAAGNSSFEKNSSRRNSEMNKRTLPSDSQKSSVTKSVTGDGERTTNNLGRSDSETFNSKLSAKVNPTMPLPFKNRQAINSACDRSSVANSEEIAFKNCSEGFEVTQFSGRFRNEGSANISELSRKIMSRDIPSNKISSNKPETTTLKIPNTNSLLEKSVKLSSANKSQLNSNLRTSHLQDNTHRFSSGLSPKQRASVVGESSSSVSSSASEQQKKQNSIPGMVLIDSHEVSGGGSIISRLKLHYKLNTAVVQLKFGHYTVSTRMIISRIQLSVFNNNQHRDSLKKRVQGMMSLFERPVIIIELDRTKHGDSPFNATHNRSKYTDSITCACAQVTQLKVLYSNNQEETAVLISQLVEQEKTKGFGILAVPQEIQQRQKVIDFYRALPQVSYVTAVCLARNFKTLGEFLNSTPAVIQKNGCIPYQRAVDIHQLITRQFRQDMLV